MLPNYLISQPEVSKSLLEIVCEYGPEFLESFIKGGLRNLLFFLFGIPEQLTFFWKGVRNRIEATVFYMKLVFSDSFLDIIKEFKPKNPSFWSISSPHWEVRNKVRHVKDLNNPIT